MTQMTLVVCDRTGAPKAELPTATLDDVTWSLTNDGQASISISPMAKGATELLLEERELQVWLEDSLVWWGVLRDMDGDFDMLRFKAEDLMSYFHYRFVLLDDLVYTGLDQLTIGANLVTYAQSAAQGTNPDLHIAIAGYTNSGVLRDRTYISDRKHNIFDALMELHTLDDGYEMSIEVYGDGRREWTPWFPQRGSNRTDIVLEYGRNIIGGSLKETSGKMATLIDATGGTSDADPFNVLAGRQKQHILHEDVAASTQYGVHVAVLPSGSRSDVPWLTSRSIGAVNARKNPVKVPTLTCRQGGRYPQLVGNVKPGDLVTVQVDRGRIQFNGTQRIKTMAWVPKGNFVQLGFTSVIEGT